MYCSTFFIRRRALSLSKRKDGRVCTVLSRTKPQVYSMCVCVYSVYGNLYLTEQGIEHESMWDLCVNEVALLVIGVCFLLLAYISLRRMKKSK